MLCRNCGRRVKSQVFWRCRCRWDIRTLPPSCSSQLWFLLLSTQRQLQALVIPMAHPLLDHWHFTSHPQSYEVHLVWLVDHQSFTRWQLLPLILQQPFVSLGVACPCDFFSFSFFSSDFLIREAPHITVKNFHPWLNIFLITQCEPHQNLVVYNKRVACGFSNQLSGAQHCSNRLSYRRCISQLLLFHIYRINSCANDYS